MSRSFEKIKKEAGDFRGFLTDRENRKTIVAIVAVVLMIFLIQVVKNVMSGTRYITGEDGEIAGVMREDENKTVSFPLTIEASKGGEKKKLNVTLTISADDLKEAEQEEPEQGGEALLSSQIQSLISELSEKGGKRIMLPAALDDGTRLKWGRGQSGTELMLLLLAPVLIWAVYLDGVKKKRDRLRIKTESVERELPAFNDQLILLLGSGLILRDAFMRIADGYRKKKKNTYFEERIISVADEAEEGVSDFVNVLLRSADDIGVSEFSRLTGVIRDNQLRGVNISGKLKNESELLWDLRKKNAEEKGRLAETKLTMPLALLLIVLVLVTAAPAIIEVEGG